MKKRLLDRRQFIFESSATTALLLNGARASAFGFDKPYGQGPERLWTTEIYQQGRDGDASWIYVGYVPRMQDPNRIRIVASAKGLTVRVSLFMTNEEVAGYASYLVRKAQQIQALQQGQVIAQWGDGIYTTPFEVLDDFTYANFFQNIVTRVRPVVNQGFDANLQLMQSFFPESVIQDNGGVYFHIVFPTTPPAAGPSSVPVDASYNTHYFEERRTKYTVKDNDIFGGFPALWFNNEQGMHGPIRYVGANENRSFIGGTSSDTGRGPEAKSISKRWQLHRNYESHGCFRLEHILALRHMMPAEVTTSQDQPLARKVKIRLVRDFDRGDDYLRIHDSAIIGVKYYWIDNSGPNEAAWKKRFYKGIGDTRLIEFPYTDPCVAQIRPLRGSTNAVNPTATMSLLNRTPMVW